MIVLIKFQTRAGDTHQFRVELLWGPPPVHGHQGLCGRGDAVAVQVKLALSVGIRARAPLGTGGDQAARPRTHLPTHRGTDAETAQATQPTSSVSSAQTQ